MSGIPPKAFDFAMQQIKDGFLFERFAQDLLCQIGGTDFTPIGGVKDRGIDGLEHCSHQANSLKTVYQMSIDQNPSTKIRTTIGALKKNNIAFDRLFYVTNQEVTKQDALQEEFYDAHGVHVSFRDVKWLAGHINETEGTIRTYLLHIESNLHQYAQVGSGIALTDLSRDPRVFVFLRQQLDSHRSRGRLDELLVESLVLFALEGTDPTVHEDFHPGLRVSE